MYKRDLYNRKYCRDYYTTWVIENAFVFNKVFLSRKHSSFGTACYLFIIN